MKLPDKVEKLKVEAAIKERGIDCNSTGGERALGFRNGADWGFEQGMLHERERHRYVVDTVKFFIQNPDFGGIVLLEEVLIQFLKKENND